MRLSKCNKLDLSFIAIFILLLSFGCQKSAESDRDAVKFPHTLFFGTNKGEVWNTNDSRNFRSFFTVDNSFVYDIVSTKDAMYYANGLVYAFEGPDDGNLVLPKGLTPGYYYPYYNNLLFCEEEGRLYVPLVSGNSLMASTDDKGKTWNTYDVIDSFYNLSSPTSLPEKAVTIQEIIGKGIYIWTEDLELFFKPYNRDSITRVEIGNEDFDDDEFIMMASTSDKLIFFETQTLLSPVQIQIVDPNTLNVIRSIDPPIVEGINTIVPRDDNFVYIGTTSGLFGLNLNTLVYTPIVNDLPEGVSVHDISRQRTTYRSDNTEYLTYLATDRGLFVSRDQDQTFTKIYDGVITSLSH